MKSRSSGENNLQAVEYLEQAVSKGFPPAMAALADLLVQIDKPKYLERAKELHQRSSDLGHDDQLWSLVGLLEDLETEALYWTDRALRNVEFAVIAELGIAFEDTSTGEIVDRAAQRGTVQALYNKGMWLRLTGDTEEDDEEAYRYFSVAAEKGHIDSMSLCYIICEEKRDMDGVGKWRRAMEQRGLYGLVQRLLEMD
jgi:TPR repeat protein